MAIEVLQRSAHRTRGFTLIEILVALAILSFSLAVIFTAITTSMRSRHAAHNYERATLLAESRISSVGIDQPLQEGTTVGRFEDGFGWRVVVSPYHEQGVDSASLIPLVVTVTVSWDEQGEKSITLSTLRLTQRH